MSPLDICLSSTPPVDQTNNQPVYGLPLEQHLDIIGQPVSTVIHDCSIALREKWMDTEGIFRIAASAAKLKLLKVCTQQLGTHTYAHTHTHIHSPTHTHIYTHAHSYTHSHTYTHTHTHLLTHTHSHTHTHSYTHTHSHTHSLTVKHSPWSTHTVSLIQSYSCIDLTH